MVGEYAIFFIDQYPAEVGTTFHHPLRSPPQLTHFKLGVPLRMEIFGVAGSFPREGFAPYPVRPLHVKPLVKTIEDSLVVNVVDTFEEPDARLFFGLVIVVLGVVAGQLVLKGLE